MAKDKTVIFKTTEVIKEKAKKLAKKENRSVGNMLEVLIEEAHEKL